MLGVVSKEPGDEGFISFYSESGLCLKHINVNKYISLYSPGSVFVLISVIESWNHTGW